MAVPIEAILRRSYERTVARNGLQFAAILYVLSVLDALFSPDVAGTPIPVEGVPEELGPAMAAGVPPISLGLQPAVAAVLSLLVGLVSLIVSIAALRTFVTDETETIPREYFTENLLWTGLNLIVGSIVFGIAVAVGLVLLILPGLFILVSLFFWEVYVAAEDENFIEAFRQSWALTGGNRLNLFALGVVALLIAFVVSIVFAIPGVFNPVVGFLIEQVGAALVGVFLLAAIGETFTRLTAAEAAEESPATE